MLLRKIRKKVKLIMWLTLLFIIPAFIWWGVGMRSTSKEKLVAKVDNYPIALEQFYQEYNFLYNQYARIFRDLEENQFKEKIRSLDIEQQALNRLVENVLLNKEIKKRHIKVSDEEIAQAIKKYPFFLTSEGTFDKEKFERALKDVPMNQWEIWQKQISSMIAFEKLNKQIIAESPPAENKEVAFQNWLNALKKQSKIVVRKLPKLTE